MKKIFIASVLLAALAIFGCASAPTKLERKFFDIQTNRVASAVVVTNITPHFTTNATVEVTTNYDSGSPLVLVRTNITIAVSWITNRSIATNSVEQYTFTPNANTALTSVVAGRTVGAFGPFAEITCILLSAAFGIWGHLRSTRARRVAAVLAQVIETGRAVLQSTPQGQQLDNEWKLWMMKHQAEQGVITDVVSLLGAVVDNATAKDAAAKLVAMMQERSAK